MALMGQFGPGVLFIQRMDIANSTPVNIGKANSFEFGISAEQKDLYGETDFAIMTAIGTRKLTGKVKSAVISGIALNAAMFGGTFTTGTTKMAVRESETVPAVTTFTVTVANSTNFIENEEVIDSTTGLPLQLVATSPATGQYSYVKTTGVYTFSADDANRKVSISYRYKDTANGQTQIIKAQPIGTTPYFRLSYWIQTQGNGFYVGFRRCISSKLQHSFKISDFDMPEIDFNASQDDSGEVLEFGYGNVG